MARAWRPPSRSPEALYDVEADPYETVNLAGDPTHAATLASMRRRLRETVVNMCDLSFYPESHLVRSAFGNPTAFGERHRDDIARLVGIADLQMLQFAEARGRLRSALANPDRWARYWALIVCSSFGKQAGEFVGAARTLASRDEEPLVRVRAAEFLALIGADDPRGVIMDVLAKADDPLVALLTLNTVVLLRDGQPGYAFKIGASDVKARGGEVEGRLAYLRE